MGETNPCDGGTPNACGGCAELDGALGDPCGTCEAGSLACDGMNALACQDDPGDSALNACGGCELFEGELETSCGVCDTGVWGCEGISVVCVGEQPEAANTCGGCGPLPGEEGEACGGEACGEGRWMCEGLESLRCDGEGVATNLCGGCDTLAGEPGAACGTCGSGRWRCDGEGSVVCEGDQGAAARNACGGCEPLPGEPEAECGDVACGMGQWSCQGPNAVVCEDEAGLVNRCGGCDPLEGTPGNACGVCDTGRWRCQTPNAVTCEGDEGEGARNACDGCVELEAPPNTACGTCDSGTWRCEGGEAVTCEGDLQEAAFNSCGGCADLLGQPDTPCGACDSGAWRCEGEEAVVCEGDQGDDVRNPCGGCSPLWAEEGEPCGGDACGAGFWACDGEESLLCGAGGGEIIVNMCGGCEAQDEALGAGCGLCASGALECGDGDYVCGGDIGGGDITPTLGYFDLTSRIIIPGADVTRDNTTTYDVELADFNDDGALDALIAVGYGSARELRVWFNNGDGEFVPGSPQHLIEEIDSRDVELANLNQDDHPDAFVAVQDGPSRVLLYDAESSRFVDSEQQLGEAGAIGVALGDLNNDGHVDAFTVYSDGPHRVWLNDGEGALTEVTAPWRTLEPDGTQAFVTNDSNDVALSDLNGDGALDVVIASSNAGDGHPNQVWLNTNARDPATATFFATTQTLKDNLNINTYDVALGDVSGDGHVDVVTCNSVTLEIWFNDGDGLFTQHSVVPDINCEDIELGDLDGDGDLDAVATGNQAIASALLLNDGEGNLTRRTSQPFIFVKATSLELGDLDNDRDLDIVIGMRSRPVYGPDAYGDGVWLNRDVPDDLLCVELFGCDTPDPNPTLANPCTRRVCDEQGWRTVYVPNGDRGDWSDPSHVRCDVDGLTCTLDVCQEGVCRSTGELVEDTCLIEGLCYDDGEGSGDIHDDCRFCSADTPEAWTARSNGQSCSSNPCFSAATCDEGICAGLAEDVQAGSTCTLERTADNAVFTTSNGECVENGACCGLWYDDTSDSDGFGDPEISVASCDPAGPDGFVLNNQDCAPGSRMLPVRLLDDRDRDGFGDPDSLTFSCVGLEDGQVIYSEPTDCDDMNDGISPMAAEICRDKVDNNCDRASTPCAYPGTIDIERLVVQQNLVEGVRIIFEERNQEYRPGMSYSVGDVNNDGFEDVALSTGNIRGTDDKAYLLLGPVGFRTNMLEADTTYMEMDGDGLSREMRIVGDINGDGFDDVVGGAPGANSSQGRACVFLGGPELSALESCNTADVVLSGENQGDAFGRSLDGVGDVNGDGFDDFVVGAHGFDRDNISGNGRDGGAAYLFLGGEGFAEGEPPAGIRLVGPGDTGYLIAAAGDVNGDELDDFIVGDEDSGGAYLVLGFQGSVEEIEFLLNRELDNASNVSVLTLTASHAPFIYAATGGGDRKKTIRNVGDLNQDGYDDLVVRFESNQENESRVQVMLGQPNIWETRTIDLSGIGDTTPGFQVVHSDELGVINQPTRTFGDFNNDGYPDLAVSARVDDASVDEVHVFFGPFTGAEPLSTSGSNIRIRHTEEDVGVFGENQAFVDLNGDGYSDLLITNAGFNTHNSDSGEQQNTLFLLNGISR